MGPACQSDAALEALVGGGADILRLNFSHGTHESHEAIYRRIRETAERLRRHVGVLQDLSGPKIRTGELLDHRPIQLKSGDGLTIETGTTPGGPGRVTTTFAELARCVRKGDRLLLAEGLIELCVDASNGTEIETTVVEGGELGEHKGITAPGVPLAASAVTPKDIEDLRFGLGLGVDMVALSFVQSAADVQLARQLIGGPNPPIIAKIERPRALDDLKGILQASDGVMVARGDLGLEVPLERLPRIQKEITREARRQGVPVIVATQVLESMIVEPRPTRAEVNDAANAVVDGVDAIMLAGETAVGAHAGRAVQTLDAIIRDAEASPESPGSAGSMVVCANTAMVGSRTLGDAHMEALCEAAITLADRGDARAIVAVTRGGATARRLSGLRPPMPILATTEREDTARRLTLNWGVVPVSIEIGDNLEAAGPRIARELVSRGLVDAGAAVVLVSVNADLARFDANYLKILRV